MGMHSASGETRGGAAAVDGLPVPRPIATASAQLRIPEPRTAVVAVSGEIDGATEKRVRDVVRSALAELTPVAVVDLRRVTFCDSAALELLCAAQRQCGECGTELRVVRTEGGCLDRVLDLAELWSEFALFTCLSEATGGSADTESAP